MRLGSFSLLLHMHLPYCRRAGRWPHGEEWLHEALLESYVPLLEALFSLRGEGVPFRIALDISPILAEQLKDGEVQQHFVSYAQDRVRRAREDEKRFQRQGQGELAALARFYQERYQHTLHSFVEDYLRDVVAALRELQEGGLVEVATSAATHAYLPLLGRDSSIYGQLKAGVESYCQHFGRLPTSIWLPECGYRPAYYEEGGEGMHIRPGLESFLEELKLRVFFAEAHTVEGGQPVGKAAGDAVGPYGAIVRRYVIPQRERPLPPGGSTYQPYQVGASSVAVMARNTRTGLQVWSATWGYPGDYWYREFHKKDGISGLQYWRITGAGAGLAQKEYYRPERAQERVQEQSRHFASLVEELARDYYRERGAQGIVLASYDAELFGHWWFEGVEWLCQVLRHLSRSPEVELTTPTQYLGEHPPQEALALAESSWGEGGGHFVWQNGDNGWMWPLIHSVEREMEELVGQFPQAGGVLGEMLNQAAREKLLLEASDWPFLISTGQAREYASHRFLGHVQRFQQLAEMARRGEFTPRDRALLEECREQDNPFPDMDYRAFCRR